MNFSTRFQSSASGAFLGGRYQFIRQLGEGGFGQTFLAKDVHLPRHPVCVIKKLKSQFSNPDSLQIARRLFDTEAKVLYLLGEHDQIPRLLAHFEENQEFYLAQEFIQGDSLANELRPGQPWPEDKVVTLLLDILQGLTFVHQQGVIHRDIKPANLIRRRQDEKVVLIDFGAVKQVTTQFLNPQPGRANLTVSIGTPGYMPNEQLGGRPCFSSDIYAVGMIGVQALTGVQPVRLRQDPRTSEIEWLDLVPQTRPELVAVLTRMVSYHAQKRYPTAAEALAALQPLGAERNPPRSRNQLTTILERQHLLKKLTTVLVRQPPWTQLTTWATDAPLPKRLLIRWSIPLALATLGTTVPMAKNSLLKPLPPDAQTAAQAEISAVSPLPAHEHRSPAAPIQPDQARTAEAPPDIPSPLTPRRSVDPEVAKLLQSANAYEDAGEIKKAREHYKKAFEADPDDPDASLGYCRSLIQEKHPEKMLEVCDLALKLHPDNPEAMWGKGTALEHLKQYREALNLYDQATIVDPQFAPAWSAKGSALLNLDRPEEAMDALNRAFELNPNLASAWTNQAKILLHLQDIDGAIHAVKRALEINSDDRDAHALRREIEKRYKHRLDD